MYTDCLGTIAKIESVNERYRIALFDDFGIYADYDKPNCYINGFKSFEDAIAYLGNDWIHYEI